MIGTTRERHQEGELAVGQFDVAPGRVDERVAGYIKHHAAKVGGLERIRQASLHWTSPVPQGRQARMRRLAQVSDDCSKGPRNEEPPRQFRQSPLRQTIYMAVLISRLVIRPLESQRMFDANADDAARLRGMISGYMISQVISATAALDLADLFAEPGMSAGALAKATATHPDALTRLLQALCALGLVEQSEGGMFTLTALGALLRSDADGSLRPLALMHGGEGTWRAWGELLHTLRTGETAFNHVFGVGAFQYSNHHPERAVLFDAYMAVLTQQWVSAILAAHDFSRARRIVDVGGGNGILLCAVLAAFPHAEGVVFDSPAGISGAARRLKEARVSQKCRIVAGDFFDAVPKAADTYILKSVLHDWSDEQAVAILENCRRALRPDSTLLVIERALPERVLPQDTHREIVMMDVHMLVATGGRERTVSQYNALFAAAGLTAIAARPTASPFTIMTAARADAGRVGGSKP